MGAGTSSGKGVKIATSFAKIEETIPAAISIGWEFNTKEQRTATRSQVLQIKDEEHNYEVIKRPSDGLEYSFSVSRSVGVQGNQYRLQVYDHTNRVNGHPKKIGDMNLSDIKEARKAVRKYLGL